MVKKTEDSITSEQVNNYKILSPMLDAVLEEMKEFSKKRQDEVLNKLKVKMINKILEQIKNVVLINEPTVLFLELLDDETLPTNSDTVLILAQFKTAMKQFSEKYYKYNSSKGETLWIIQ